MTEETQLKRILEGALLAAGEPLSLERLSMLFAESEKPDNAQLRSTLKEIVADHAGRGFELKEVASGWRFQVCQDLSDWVGRLWEEKPARYSRAMLETLALIAYRQPATRGEIEEIRGVSVSSNIIRTLIEREWIRVVGHRDVPGKPAMFATTRTFLDYFNLKNLGELPTLAEIRDLDKINAELEFGQPPTADAGAGAEPGQPGEENQESDLDSADIPGDESEHAKEGEFPERSDPGQGDEFDAEALDETAPQGSN